MNLTAQQLNGTHIGKTVTIEIDGGTYTAPLRNVKHWFETETIYGGGMHELRTDRRYYVNMTVGAAQLTEVPDNTPITIQEEQ